MKFLRFILEVFLFITLFPLIVLIGLVWLIFCIRAALLLDQPIKEGFKVWIKYIKTGLEMNKDFILNGL